MRLSLESLTMMQFLQKSTLDPKDTNRTRDEYLSTKKQTGKKLKRSLPSLINISKTMSTPKALIIYGINLNLICIQLLINTYHIRAVLHEIGPHGSLLRYENYSRKGKGYIATVNKYERKTKRVLRTNCAT